MTASPGDTSAHGVITQGEGHKIQPLHAVHLLCHSHCSAAGASWGTWRVLLFPWVYIYNMRRRRILWKTEVGQMCFLFCFVSFQKGQCDISGFPHSQAASFNHVPCVRQQPGYAHQGTSLLNSAPGSTSHHSDAVQICRKHCKAHVCLNLSHHMVHAVLAACNTAAFGLPPFEQMKYPDDLFNQTLSRHLVLIASSEDCLHMEATLLRAPLSSLCIHSFP